MKRKSTSTYTVEVTLVSPYSIIYCSARILLAQDLYGCGVRVVIIETVSVLKHTIDIVSFLKPPIK